MDDCKRFSRLHEKFFVYTHAYIVHARAVATATSSTCTVEKTAAVLVTMLEENKVLCRGRLLRVSDVDTSLLSMLQGLFSTQETSESVTQCLHSVFTAASAEGIHLEADPDDKVCLHMEFGRRHVFFHFWSPSHSEDVDPTASTRGPVRSINDVLLEAASEM